MKTAMSTLSFDHHQTQHISPEIKRTHYTYLIDHPVPLDHNTIRTQRINLEISGHEPGAYFDVVVFPVGNYYLTLILIIAINMAAPTREQFMAGVNSTGPDGRTLPAGAAAAARMTAAEQEAARKADEETFATSSAAIRKVEREKDKLARKEEKGEQKSLLRRLFGGVVDKIVSAFKREQEKMN
jgi:hypothetical protein